MISGCNLRKEQFNKKFSFSKATLRSSLERYLRLGRLPFFRKQRFLRSDRIKKFYKGLFGRAKQKMKEQKLYYKICKNSLQSKEIKMLN